MAKARLREFHQVMLRKKLEDLKKQVSRGHITNGPVVVNTPNWLFYDEKISLKCWKSGHL